MLFFVMLLFLFEAVVLVKSAMKVEEIWHTVEASITALNDLDPTKEFSSKPLVNHLLDIKYHSTAKPFRKYFPWTILWWARIEEAKDELQYALVRERFVESSGKKMGEKPLPADFDFAGYLRRISSDRAAEILEISVNTWWVVILFIIGILEIPSASHLLGLEVNVYWLCGLSWTIWIVSFVLGWKLKQIVYALTPRHTLLAKPKKKFAPLKGSGLELSAGAGAGTAPLINSNDPPYEQLKPTKDANKHELLFWGGRDGPSYCLFTLRALMLMSSVSTAVIYSWLVRKPQDVWGVLVAMGPQVHILLALPYQILPLLVLATSIEQLRETKACNETLLEMKTEHTLRMLKLLQMLQVQAKRLQKLSSKTGDEEAPKEHKKLDPEKEAELRHVFELFDEDGSGSIDVDELGHIMKSMGLDLDDQALHLIFSQMDTDGGGEIDFEEFADVMAEDDEPHSPEEIATQIFEMLDKENTGFVTEHMLVEALESMKLPGLSRDDIASAMGLFNATHEGITKKDFIAGIELMQTFG